jgi:subtilisin family serine protease
MRRFAAVGMVALGLAACRDGSIPTGSGLQPSLSVTGQAQSGGIIPGQYIVVFRSTVSDPIGLTQQLANEQGAVVQFRYTHALRGFSAQMSDAAAQALARNPNVELVEPDQVVTAIGTETMDGNGDPWGLDRIDARSGLSGSYTYPGDGSGVTAYIIDTGILTTHNEFGGRASGGFSAISDGNGTNDCHGHGTHVAGTVGGQVYGVAKGVTLVAVRVLDCGGSGAYSGVIAGVDWVTGNHPALAVANMSLGGGASSALDQAIQNSIASGVSYAVAAGNGNFAGIAQDACGYSPARVPQAMTIGATTKTDVKASWSNYGSCVDFFAPGVGIKSAWIGSNSATNTISGTSMATPHTAGVAALYLQQFPGSTPQQVRDGLYDATTKSVVTSSSTTNNHLLYSPPTGFSSSPPPPPSTPTLSVTGSFNGKSGKWTANLSWSGLTGASVVVYLNGASIGTTANDGAVGVSGRGSGTNTFKVCETSGSTCTNEASITF